MTWTPFVDATAPPRAVPILLAAAAGYVDACTFLGLFGFFVAQVTGSFVTAGADLVVGWTGAAAVLAVPVFFAGGAAATLAAVLGQALTGCGLAFALLLETVLLIGFMATFAAAGPSDGVESRLVIASSLLGLAAMGVQSALVRLMMRDVASTNVMTTNTSQVAIDATQLMLARLWRGEVDDDARCRHAACRRRLRSTLPLVLSFIAGTAIGAVAFATAGFWVLLAPLAAVGGLAVWAMRLGTRGKSPPR